MQMPVALFATRAHQRYSAPEIQISAIPLAALFFFLPNEKEETISNDLARIISDKETLFREREYRLTRTRIIRNGDR